VGGFGAVFLFNSTICYIAILGDINFFLVNGASSGQFFV
jgi:hypothetical protein